MLSDEMSQKGLLYSGMLQSTDSQLGTDVSGETVGPIFKSQTVARRYSSSRNTWSLKMGPMGSTETSIITNLRRVTSRKSEYLIYTVAGAYNHLQKDAHLR